MIILLISVHLKCRISLTPFNKYFAYLLICLNAKITWIISYKLSTSFCNEVFYVSYTVNVKPETSSTTFIFTQWRADVAVQSRFSQVDLAHLDIACKRKKFTSVAVDMFLLTLSKPYSAIVLYLTSHVYMSRYTRAHHSKSSMFNVKESCTESRTGCIVVDTLFF